MTERSRTLARIKAYRLEGLSHSRIATKLGLTKHVVKHMLARERRHDERPEAAEVAFDSMTKAQSYKCPTPRENDCGKHLELIAVAHGSGFPVLNIQYRRAA